MARSLKDSISAFNKGEKEAFNDIYAATYRSVYLAVKVLMKNHPDAEAAIGEVYVVAYKQLGSLRDPNTAVAWFRERTRNVCLDRLRKTKDTPPGVGKGDAAADQPKKDGDAQPKPAVAQGGAEADAKKERGAILLEMVAKLPYEQREAVLYHCIQGLSVEMIAELCMCSLGTARSRIESAQAKLRSMDAEREKEGVASFGFGLPPYTDFAIRREATRMALSPARAEAILIAVRKSAGAGVSTVGGSTAKGGLSAAGGVSEAAQLATAPSADLGGDAAWTKTIATTLAVVAAVAIAIGVILAIQYNRQPDAPTGTPPSQTGSVTDGPDVNLFDLDWSVNGRLDQLDGSTDIIGNYYDTENFYIVVGRRETVVTVNLDGNFASLTGTLVLIAYWDGFETMVFKIEGDGETIYERFYKSEKYDEHVGLDTFPVDVDIDVSGISELRISYIGADDVVDKPGERPGNYTKSDVGLVVFVVHRAV
jgi:RNA polymerase sigma-70 factor (ECF subfamily)